MPESRLDKIEQKLDDLNAAITKLAVVDTKIAHLMLEEGRHRERLKELESLPERLSVCERFNKNVSRFLWAIAVAIIALISEHFIGV